MPLAALWPRFRRWAGPLPLGLTLIGTAAVPVATQSGEALERTGLESSPLVQAHQALGESMLYWALGLTAAAAAVFWLHLKTRAADSNRKPGQALTVGIAVFAVVAAVGTTVHIVRVGDSGSRAAWSGTTFSDAG